MSSFTEALIAADPSGFQRATQSPFLQRAASSTLPKATLGRWLANDRLYIHGYLLAWTVDALVNIQRESGFFIETAERYSIDINLPTGEDGRVPASAKLEGLRRFEALFDGLSAGVEPLPWLESAVVFYGTEKCYLDAWTWAKSHMNESEDSVDDDEDGGAVRREFIANWTSPDFRAFVKRLGVIVDEAVRAQGEDMQDMLLRRGLAKWRELLAAEEAFWPDTEA
ncbi:hypothetical protein LLEC1_07318 [Akanthomyces lecanii]|uniref:Thiaminase-2/PQQC domain-containing protein n=1 Tax=Cordyceps confragosa TaxID=2714763 RepID=A0A179I9P1_CORDF|nr:hypothetical protein LLEC1_07318 [Akanthomyces lecanii]